MANAMNIFFDLAIIYFPSIAKIGIITLPVLSHHPPNRSGTVWFVRILKYMFPFAKWRNNYRGRYSLPYANI